eukprot:Protomagalhaensia_wolfi_Nauph_80__331@NODE_1184_length_1671_cov_149_034926_g908_i0_p5_GENE_NODE_1184_length_1671_cov_149_034926_g908_i0NODE_1184_length_1671_cov_149_034926_g908_i0_p5_ORF_typecomplete_len102_score1_68DUF1614/PF07758_11/0_0077_NODE_1184_length_1671_cov_149_034926_g908_i0611916
MKKSKLTMTTRAARIRVPSYHATVMAPAEPARRKSMVTYAYVIGIGRGAIVGVCLFVWTHTNNAPLSLISVEGPGTFWPLFIAGISTAGTFAVVGLLVTAP